MQSSTRETSPEDSTRDADTASEIVVLPPDSMQGTSAHDKGVTEEDDRPQRPSSSKDYLSASDGPPLSKRIVQ